MFSSFLLDWYFFTKIFFLKYYILLDFFILNQNVYLRINQDLKVMNMLKLKNFNKKVDFLIKNIKEFLNFCVLIEAVDLFSEVVKDLNYIYKNIIHFIW